MKKIIPIILFLFSVGCTKEYSISTVKYVDIQIGTYNNGQGNLTKVYLKVDEPVKSDTKFEYSFKSNGTVWEINQTLHLGESDNIFYTMIPAGWATDIKLLSSNGYILKQ